MNELTLINSEKAPAAIGPYSQGVAYGDLVFTSGQIPLTVSGELIDGDATAQTIQVFANLRAVLQEAGTELSKVIKATVFLVDMFDFAAVNAVYAAEFGEHRPARSTVQVARLPRDVRVEIELIAIR